MGGGGRGRSHAHTCIPPQLSREGGRGGHCDRVQLGGQRGVILVVRSDTLLLSLLTTCDSFVTDYDNQPFIVTIV